jgi:PAS domain S-box-containing protein
MATPDQDIPDRIDIGRMARSILEAAPDAVVGIGADGRILFWNSRAEALFGWRVDDVLGKQVADTVFTNRDPGTTQLPSFNQDGSTGVQTLELAATDRSGRQFPVEMTLAPAGEDKGRFFCAFIRDITARKQVELELIHRNEFSELLINSLPGIFYLFDDQQRYLLWNENMERITGFSPDEIRGMSPLDFFEGDDKVLIEHRLKKVFTDGTAEAEACLVTKNGQRVPYYFTGKYIEVEGKPCLMGMGVDISGRVQLQQELDEKTRQVQQQMTTAVITAQETERSQLGQELHDNVNQVLTTVKLYNEMLRDGLGDPDAIIDKSIGHLQGCINEIRSISKRLSAPTLGSISLTESIKELAESINLTKKVNIIYTIEGFLNRDISQDIHLALYRIVQEQLNNILKYAQATFATITIKRMTGTLELIIRDDGQGFDTRVKSSGIGLSNMKTRAESLGGRFRVQSAPGSGCTVFVWIPLERNAPDQAPSSDRFL